MNGTSGDNSLPIEQFIQALTTQLDHAQSAMAVKAKNLNLPLTFALKDIALDLLAHVEVVKSEVRIRPASAGDGNASTIRLALTTITRPMIEENAAVMPVDPEGPSLREVVGDDFTDEDRKKLEWAGVQTVAQLRRMQETGGDRTIERVTNLPIERLRRALQRATLPSISHVLPQTLEGGTPDEQTLLSVRGARLMQGQVPRVTIGGEPVGVVKANDGEILLVPGAGQMSGDLVVEAQPGSEAVVAFDLRQHWRAPAVSPVSAQETDKPNGQAATSIAARPVEDAAS
jgi:hypothetical protein